MPRQQRDQALIKVAKAHSEARCAVCGWVPPKGLEALGVSTATMIHAHHVTPLSCGGYDSIGNLVLLCPTHHAVAHRLGRMYKRYGKMRWSGPSDREQVIAELKMMEEEPERFAAYVANGRNWGQLHSEMYAELLRLEEACNE